jgi:small subunit ribosomal protein S1
MKIIKKLFGKKEVEVQKTNQYAKKSNKPKKVKTGPNGKEQYRIEKAQRKIDAQKQREALELNAIEEKRIEDEKRLEEAKVAEAERLAKLEVLRAENEAIKAAQKTTEKRVEQKLELFGYEIETLKKGDVVEVEILESDRDSFLVRSTTNFQEAKLPKMELDNADVKIGDKITVVVWKIYAEETYVSLRRHLNKENLKTQMNEIEEKAIVGGTVTGFKAPNFVVKLDNGLVGKVYIKNIDTVFVNEEDASKYVDQKFEFVIVKKFTNAKVGQSSFELSRRDLLNAKQEEFVNNLALGQKIEIEEYTFNKGGLEFYYNGIRGFVPLSELSYSYISNSEDASKQITGKQELLITEIKKHRGQFNITGSIKKTKVAPFDQFIASKNVNDIIDGPVTKVETYGLFIEVSQDVRGLLHKSEFSQELNATIKSIKTGDVITVRINGIDLETQKVSLSANLVPNEDGRE